MADVVCLVWKCVLFGLVSPERIEVAIFNNLDSAHKTEHHPALRQQTRETRRGVDTSAGYETGRIHGVFALCALQLVESHIDIKLHFVSLPYLFNCSSHSISQQTVSFLMCCISNCIV